MWTEERLVEDLRELGLREGMSVLAHTSLRAIGPIAGGAETLVRAFRRTLGSSGSLMVPTFTDDLVDPTGWLHPPISETELERLRALTPTFDGLATPVDRNRVGVFPEIVRQQPDAFRSDHPTLSFAAIGANARFLTERAPFHYPLGTDSPLSRLHQLDGVALLIGVDHRTNSSLHLGEVWAAPPYIHRTTTVKTGPDQWTVMRGSPECSEGFQRIASILRQSRVLRQGYIGNAESQWMRQRELVSMALALLNGDGAALLCSQLDCRWCILARKLTEPSSDEHKSLPPR